MAEEPALIVFVLITVVSWVHWYWVALLNTWMRGSAVCRFLVTMAPLVCVGILYGILAKWSSADVQSSAFYMGFYTLFGAAWVGGWRFWFVMCGISVRDDALERRNVAAALAVAGALVALTLCFAGGNIGDGPGYEVVIFAAGLSTVSLALLWWLLESVCCFAEVITVERDAGSGLRLAGGLVGLGLILGYGAAGNWVSIEATVADFLPHLGAACVLAVGVGFVELLISHRGRGPVTTWLPRELVLSGGYVAAAAVYLVGQGWWQ
jgi:hypothetical protein